MPRCRLGATCGLMHRSKQHLYSISSSARPGRESGKVRPSIFAVFRLRTSSTLVELLHGEVGRLGTLENLAGVDADQAQWFGKARTVS